MRTGNVVTASSHASSLEINRVLRNTYFLLSLTLLFSAACASYAMISNAKPMGILLFFVGAIGLSMLTTALRNSAWGIAAVFAYTGFLGYFLGPILNLYISSFANGTQIIMTALGATGIIFFGLSAYVLTTRKNFSYMGGFIIVAIIAAFVMMIAGIVFQVPMLTLLVSGIFAVLSSAFILYTTSSIINGGERNYIMATISLYAALFNLFVSLLNILGFMSRD